LGIFDRLILFATGFVISYGFYHTFVIKSMVVFPNCKINIGLNICGRRPDDFHNIETVFYPVPWRDILEIIVSDREEFTFEGIAIGCELKDNLCYKAWRLLQNDFDLPPVKLFLYKKIPGGAGLGGGSSDAAFTLTTLNSLFSLQLDETALMQYASELGSDCAFFIKNHPVFATGKGNVFSEIAVDLNGYYLLIIKPPIHIATAGAYKMVIPGLPTYSLKDAVRLPLSEWKPKISNDFEKPVFAMYPELQEIRNKLYSLGAVYAAMSGSGSAIYSLFDKKLDYRGEFAEATCWMKQL
jgi:4-diphosphocytidyl-2-C-methyl-D-erythritol kinase